MLKGGDTPSLCVGETSRTIQERAMEHWGAAKREDKKSHMHKHQSMEHAGEPPQFHMRVVSYHRSALNRQGKEAVRIRRRGGASSILNSRSEFNRCHIPRLVFEEEEEETTKMREQHEKLEMEKLMKAMEQEDLSWEERKSTAWSLVVKKRRRERTSGEQGSQEGGEPGERRKSKKLKYAKLGEDWGEQTPLEEEQTSLGSSREEVGHVILPYQPSLSPGRGGG